MCGRISCHLCKEDYKKAASFLNEKNMKYEQPEWFEKGNCGFEFKPSTNIAPTDVTPVLVSGEHYNKETKRLLQPMMFGMIPRWHKGEYKSHGLTTNNCRIEGILTSKLYNTPLKLGQRCTIICEGFYEWQTTKGGGQSKQPYFIYAPQDNDFKVEETNSWITASWDEQKGWQGPKLLMMAGLYDKWTSLEGKDIFSYSIITMESNSTLSWLHHRMPAILDTDEAVESWLDFTNTEIGDALECLKPVKSLVWHPVSTQVNNSRNKDSKCNKPIDLKKTSASSAFLSSWLKKDSGTVKRKLDSTSPIKEDAPVKKSKE